MSARVSSAVASILPALMLGACEHVHASPAQATPAVLIELFTSEGCSSCPPAEAFLRGLDREQAAGTNVIALEYHVDYWDQLGWRDPFSIPEARLRQEAYARVLGGGVFTPEIVVEGRRILSGADRALRSEWLSRAIAPAAAILTLSRTGTRVVLHASHLPTLSANDVADVFVAVTEAGLVSHVQAGENRGQVLRHAPIVRRIVHVGEATAAIFSWHGDLALERTWKASALRVIAFVQSRRERRIIGSVEARG